MSKSPQEILESIEADVLASDSERARKFEAAIKAFESAGDKDRAEEARWSYVAFSFLAHPPDLDPANEKSRFAPMVEFSNGPAFPVLDALPDEAFDYFGRTTADTKNPALKARYADLCWERLRSHEDARVAVEAYRELSEVYLSGHLESQDPEHGMQLVDALLRGIELAVLLGDDRLTRAACKRALEVADELVGRKLPRWAVDVTRGLLTCPKTQRAIDLPRLRRVVDDAIESYSSEQHVERWHFPREWLGLKVRVCKLESDENGAREALLSIARTFEEEGDCKSELPFCGKMGAADFYLRAEEACKAAGGAQSEIERLQRKHEETLIAAKGEFRPVSTTVQIPADEFQRHKTEVERLVEEHGLPVIGTTLLIPNVADVRETAKKLLQEHPLVALFPTVAVREDRVISRSRSPDENLEVHMIRHLLLDIGFKARSSTRWAVDHLLECDQLTVDTFRKALDTAGLIESWRRPILIQGLEHYLQGDYLSAVHLWTFQIEGILRDTVGALGRRTTFLDAQHRTQARRLPDLLADEKLLELLGEDLLMLVKVVLCERAGMNMRNLVAHGLRCSEAFTREAAECLLVIIIALAN